MSRSNPEMVDPRLPRLGQAITGTVLGVAFLTQWPPAIPLVAALLAGASILGPRVNVYAYLFRWLKRSLRWEPPAYLEEAAPPRFSNTVGFVFTAVATVAYYSFGAEALAWTLAIIVSALALLAASTGLCVGCELYVLIRRAATRGRVARRITVPGTGG